MTSSKRTALTSHGVVASDPSAIYCSGPVVLRIGNGGAGATGLIEALALAYLDQRRGPPAAITWVCNHSRNTQLALFHGYIDLALTYERASEASAGAEGWSVTHGCVFHDHFVLAGPVSDPAGVSRATDLHDAFRRIAQRRAPFHSRADGSATMAKERSIWNATGVRPWEDPSESSSWYTMTEFTPSDAVRNADVAQAYLLTDRSTLLRLVADGMVRQTTVFFEPTGTDDVLMNSCYALSAPDAGDEVHAFASYALSPAGQRIIADFGRAEAGLPLFAPVKDGFAKGILRGGRPNGGKWVIPMLSSRL